MHATPPPDGLVRSLVEGPSPVAGLEWHDEVASTNLVALQAAARGMPEIHVVVADRQTAGRGRRGRTWEAGATTAVLCSLLVRPGVGEHALPLLPLLAGLALADAVAPFVPGRAVGLKWPNDLLLDARKAAGILVEVIGPAAAVGIGCNVSACPEGAACLGAGIDRWRVFAALVGVFGNRYADWRAAPTAFLDAYRARCVTLGQPVRVTRVGEPPLEGVAEEIRSDGALVVAGVPVLAGDVEHVRAR